MQDFISLQRAFSHHLLPLITGDKSSYTIRKSPHGSLMVKGPDLTGHLTISMQGQRKDSLFAVVDLDMTGIKSTLPTT